MKSVMKSSWRQATSSVPQGLVLGPIFFNTLINDLNSSTDWTPSKFTDDNKVWEEADTTKDLLFGRFLTGWRMGLKGIPWCSTRGNAKSWAWRIVISSTHIKPAGKYLVRERSWSPGTQESGQKTVVHSCSKDGWQCMRLHFQEHCQQVNDREPSPLLSTSKTYLKYYVQIWTLQYKKD